MILHFKLLGAHYYSFQREKNQSFLGLSTRIHPVSRKSLGIICRYQFQGAGLWSGSTSHLTTLAAASLALSTRC